MNFVAKFVIDNRLFLQTKAGKVLDVPLIVTEHYPEKLGKTVAEVDISHAKAVMGKTYFSMMTPQVKNVMKEIFGEKPQDVVLYGLEVIRFGTYYFGVNESVVASSLIFAWSKLLLIYVSRTSMSIL